MDVRKDRDKYVGGSDAPAIMGVSPFKTRWDVLLEKAGFKELFEGNEYTEYGTEMEEKIREYVNEMALTEFAPDVRIDGFRRYHADGYDGEKVLEIKTTSQMHDTADEYEAYMIQLQMGMDMFGADKGYLAVYERPADFDTTFNPLNLQIFEVSRNEEMIEEVRKTIESFMADLEYLKENPLATEETLPSSRAIVPKANHVLALESKIAELKALEKEYKEAKAALKAAMEQNHIDLITTDTGTRIKLVRDGEDKVVYEFDDENFKKDYPNLWESYSEPKIRKGKSGYVRITPKRGSKV